MSSRDAADLEWLMSEGMQVSALPPVWIAMIISCWSVKLLKLPSVTLTHVCGANSNNWWAKGLPGVVKFSTTPTPQVENPSDSVTILAHQEEWIIFWGRHKIYVDSMYENNGYACNMSKTFFQGRRKFLQGGEVLPLVTGLVTRWLGMQTSHCRPDWYMGCIQKYFWFVFFWISWNLL